ncbi:SDR family NAD(P)-dependent oxidoreductase [Gordonia alkanivorans]|uniref:SDR family NAD(P)-dependent oxidoreductase n=1 Tax=Gordonia alkanivorans TaxID=84096 RepID=UPI0024472729|nr:SDR family oxidoreductase [Gordonia alkanivorans]MDH3052489.1 SDR family NAD(P)-dependent oxidoreductase [Gordonia alkanivorans]
MSAIVITGAGGDIGRAIRRQLESDGAATVGLDLETSEGVEVAVDLADLVSVSTVATELAATYDIRGIVHVAAYQPTASVGSFDTDAWEQAMRVNCLSLDVLTGACASTLKRNRGTIVAISSIHAKSTAPGMGIYAATKAALESWVRSAAIELAPAVTVNGIAPGAVNGRKLDEGLERFAVSERLGVLERISSRAPARRVGDPGEIAELVAFLMNADCRFMTGTTVAIDGGSQIRLAGE